MIVLYIYTLYPVPYFEPDLFSIFRVLFFAHEVVAA